MSYFLQQLESPVKLAISHDNAEHARYTMRKWKSAVRRGYTIQGYPEWVVAQLIGEFKVPEKG